MTAEIDIRPPQYARDAKGKLILDADGNKIWSGPAVSELAYYKTRLETARRGLRIVANATCEDSKVTALKAYEDSEP